MTDDACIDFIGRPKPQKQWVWLSSHVNILGNFVD